MNDSLVLIGTCTGDASHGIRVARFNPDSGSLRLDGDQPVLPMMNPTWLTLHPEGTHGFAPLEVGQWDGKPGAAIAVFQVNPAVYAAQPSPAATREPVLSLHHLQPIEAQGPCHATVYRDRLHVAGFSAGTLTSLPLLACGMPCADRPTDGIPSDTHTHCNSLTVEKGVGASASGAEKECPSETPARAHQVVPTPDGRWLAVTDMGRSRIFLLPPERLRAFGTVSLETLPPDIFRLQFPGNSGPRHLVFSRDGGLAYVCGELDNRLHVCRYDGQALSHAASLSALPPDAQGVSYCGAIRLSPDGRHVLVSNRGHDSIAVFPLGEDGMPESPTHHSCGGHFTRDMVFSPDGRYLLCANQRGNTVSVLSWEAGTGTLMPVGSLSVDAPTCLVFLPRTAPVRYSRMLEGRNAVVTGGAQGLGREIALLFARHGARVAITDVLADKGRETEALLKAEHPDCFFMPGDAGCEADLETFTQTVLQRFGQVDLLDNNVGINITERVDEIDEAHFERVMDVNLRSAMRLCKAFLPGMKAAGGGSILFTSTIHSQASITRFGSYAASKGAINAYARVLAIEHGPDNIRVNVVVPGGIRSSLSQSFHDRLSPQDQKRSHWVVGNPMPHIGFPMDIANAHLFLAGAMSRRITAATLRVDGGSVAQLHKTDAYPYPDAYPMARRLDWFRQDWMFRRHGGTTMDLYRELGVKTFINAWDTMSVIGGSRMEAETLAAMRNASHAFVPLAELQERVGAEIARLTHNEAAYITGGASAGLAIAAAVCIAGNDRDALRRLPDDPGPFHEIVVMKGHRNAYDFALKAAGATIVEAGDPLGCTQQQLEAAITERTCAIFYFDTHYFEARGVPLAEVVRIARRHGVKVVVDGAAQLPPVENLWHYTRDCGADMALFSGGKGLRGPQQGGLAVGTRDMVEGFRLIAPPNQGLARSFKAGREEIAGVFTALKRFLDKDQLANRLRYIEEGTRYVLTELNRSGLFHCERLWPGPTGQHYPWLEARLAGAGKAADLQAALKAEDPGILVGLRAEQNAITLNLLNLEPSEIDVVIDKAALHARRLAEAQSD